MIHADDLARCREAIRQGSHSFNAAAKLLPPGISTPALALYAFCRLADDAVDLDSGGGGGKAAAVRQLQRRLARVYAGRPFNTAPDRAFAAVVEAFDMPRALPEALLEGLAWDAEGRRYDSLGDLTAYAARVAGSVGAMMAVLMRVRARPALARACDLGVAMQFTNIARDVGEDAQAGRLYLPLDWLAEEGVSAEPFLAAPVPSPGVRRVTARLLAEAQGLYRRADTGIAELPLACRPGILAARHVYAAIGAQVRAAGHDSVTARAVTGRAVKLGWLAVAGMRAAASTLLPRAPRLYAQPLPQTAFLVEAAAAAPPAPEWSDTLCTTLAQLRAQDREQRARLIGGRAGAN